MQPVLFHLGESPVHSYPVLIGLGFLLGLWLASRAAPKAGIDRRIVVDLCWWLILSGLVGSRIAFILVNWDQYYYPCFDYARFNALYPNQAIDGPDCLRLFRFWTGGLVFLGGVIGAIAVMIWFLRREKISFWPMADVIIPSLALGQGFGRLGCFLAGCCFGQVSQAPWAIAWPRKSLCFLYQWRQGLIGAQAAQSLPVHPVQLYDAAFGFALCAFLCWLRRRKRYDGQVFLSWLWIYPLGRSAIELFRGDSDRGFLFQWTLPALNRLLGLPEQTVNLLSTSQALSLGMVAVAMVLLWRMKRRDQNR